MDRTKVERVGTIAWKVVVIIAVIAALAVAVYTEYRRTAFWVNH